MLFYRAQLEGEVARLVSLSAGPVLACRGLGRAGGRSRITLRYAGPDGRVQVHRGWYQADLPAGTQLKILGYQLDGSACLLSLGPRKMGRLRPERFDDRFSLPFALSAWGVTELSRLSTQVVATCTPRPGGLLLRGLLRLGVESPVVTLRRVIPFCRLMAVEVTPGLNWRAYAGVVKANCRVGPGGRVEGRAQLQATCLGLPGRAKASPVGGQPGGWARRDGETAPLLGEGAPHHGDGKAPRGAGEEGPAVQLVRQVSAQVGRLQADLIMPGRALLYGSLELDVAWIDRLGQSRWHTHQLPFSTLLPVEGLEEGDRLEPVAQVDRLVWRGEEGEGQGRGEHEGREKVGPQGWAQVHLALGVTGLRQVHLELAGRYYRMEQVVGQALGSLYLTTSLFPGPEGGSPSLPVIGPTGQGPTIRLVGPASDGVVGAGPGIGQSSVSRPEGDVSFGLLFEPMTEGGWRAVQRQVRRIPLEPGIVSLAGPGGGGGSTQQVMELPVTFEAILGLEVEATREGWHLRCLVRSGKALRLLEQRLQLPEGAGAHQVAPVTVTAWGRAIVSDQPEQVQVAVEWGRVGDP